MEFCIGYMRHCPVVQQHVRKPISHHHGEAIGCLVLVIRSPWDLRRRFVKFIANISQRHNEYVSLSMLYCLKTCFTWIMCFWTAAIGYLLEEIKINLNVRFRDQHYRFGVGWLGPKYRKESEQDKGGVTILNSTKWLWLWGIYWFLVDGSCCPWHSFWFLYRCHKIVGIQWWPLELAGWSWQDMEWGGGALRQNQKKNKTVFTFMALYTAHYCLIKVDKASLIGKFSWMKSSEFCKKGYWIL